MTDRIEQIRAEARAARSPRRPTPPRSRTSASSTSDARPSCRTCCGRRRAPGRRARRRPARPRTRRARRSKPRSSSAPSSSPAHELEQRLERDRVDITLPARPGSRDRAPAPDHPDPARDRGRVHRPRLQRRRGTRGRDRLLQLRRAQPRADASLAADDRHVLRRADARHLRPERAAAARPHLAGPGPRDGAPAAAALHRRARVGPTGPTTTPRTRRSSTRSRGSRSTPTSRSATSRGRCWRSRARSSATSARFGCGRTSSRSPSRASRSTCRASTAPRA